MTTDFICPVCGFPDLESPPRSASGSPSHEVCLSCGFEFGFDDDLNGDTYESWRARWIASGMQWSFSDEPAPPGWNPQAQLDRLLAD